MHMVPLRRSNIINFCLRPRVNSPSQRMQPQGGLDQIINTLSNEWRQHNVQPEDNGTDMYIDFPHWQPSG